MTLLLSDSVRRLSRFSSVITFAYLTIASIVILIASAIP